MRPMADERRSFLAVDAEALPKHFDAASAEKKWDAIWQRSGYHYDPSRRAQDLRGTTRRRPPPQDRSTRVTCSATRTPTS
jgi:hypothetical protein